MSIDKKALKTFNGRFKFEDVVASAIHGYSKDITDIQEKMLKALLIAFNRALDNFGIEVVYFNPEVIKRFLSLHKNIDIFIQKVCEKDGDE